MILIGSAMIGDGCQLGDRHLEAAVTDDRKDQFIGPRELRADRGRQAKAHGAEAAGVDPQARRVEANELRGPHLMLADVGGNDGLAAGEPVDLAHHMLRFDFAGGYFGRERMLGLPGLNLASPFGARRRILLTALRRQFLQNLVQFFEHSLHVADDRQIGRAILADFRRIDIHVDHLGMRREGRQTAGDSIVKAHAQSDQ